MVILSRVWTRTGDDGTTALGDMSRTPKTDPRLAAYADVDEAGTALGLALATAGEELDAQARALLRRVQNDLFDVGADLCTPLRPVADGEHQPLRVLPPSTTALEEACDRWNEELPALRSFVLAGGTVGAAHLHAARTVVRRAERSVWAALERYGDAPSADGPGGVNPETARYLNRLSDLLFVLARVANRGDDVLWQPGAGAGAGAAPPPPPPRSA